MQKRRTYLVAAALAAGGLAPAPALAQMSTTAVSAPAAASASLTQVDMVVGEVRSLPVGGVTRVAVGSGKVLTATVLPGEVLFLAEAPGTTSVFLWDRRGAVQRYQVRITAVDTNDNVAKLSDVLKGIPGVKVQAVGDQVVLTGAVSKPDLARVQLAAGSFPRTLNLVREEDVSMKKMVYLKLQIMEFKKNALSNLGIDWTSSSPITGPAAALTFDALSNNQFRFQPQTLDPTFTVGQGAARPLDIARQSTRAYLGIATTIASRINLAVSNGDAWTLAAPEISTRSGGEAKFLAGGQVPLPTVSAVGQSNVTFKDFGIRLLIKPVADDQDNIAAAVQTELSAIDPSITVQGIPGFTTRVTDSEVNMKNGQTLVISGLLQENANNNIDKLPFLGDLPVLGNLFKSTNFQSGRTDLVIFVTPTVTDPAAAQNRQRLDKAKDLRDRFENFLGDKGIVD